MISKIFVHFTWKSKNRTPSVDDDDDEIIEEQNSKNNMKIKQ